MEHISNYAFRTIESLKRQKAFAWAKVYENHRENNERDRRYYDTLVRRTDDVAIPQHIKDELLTMAKELHKQWECPICMEFIPHDAIALTNCGHLYCKACLTSWKQTERNAGKNKWKCAVCNRHHKFNEEE
jgi:hypothetical protein